MLKKALAIFVVAWLFITPALGEVTLDSAIISPGGALDLNNGTGAGSIHLQDIKGQPLTGTIQSSDGSITIQLGGIYVLVPQVIEDTTNPLAAYGSVPLTIARAGQDIKISWDKTKYPVPPNIYVLIGDGTGKFINTYSAVDWKLNSDVSIASQFDLTKTAQGYILHKGQVGGGAAEVYYKALQTAVTPTTPNPRVTGNKTCFATAMAVGKMDIKLKVGPIGSNYISNPFIRGFNSIIDVFNPAQFEAGTKVYSQINVNNPAKDQYDFAIAKLTDAGWVNSFTSQPIENAFTILPEKSYMVQVPREKVITLFGRVLTDGETREINIMAFKNTYFGNSRAVAVDLGASDVNARLKLSDQVKGGDKIFFPQDTEYNFDIAKYDSAKGKWLSSFTGRESTMKLKLPLGYMYYRNDNSYFGWQR